MTIRGLVVLPLAVLSVVLLHKRVHLRPVLAYVLREQPLLNVLHADLWLERQVRRAEDGLTEVIQAMLRVRDHPLFAVEPPTRGVVAPEHGEANGVEAVDLVVDGEAEENDGWDRGE